jgi:hypothetical protein
MAIGTFIPSVCWSLNTEGIFLRGHSRCQVGKRGRRKESARLDWGANPKCPLNRRSEAERNWGIEPGPLADGRRCRALNSNLSEQASAGLPRGRLASRASSPGRRIVSFPIEIVDDRALAGDVLFAQADLAVDLEGRLAIRRELAASSGGFGLARF